jgi:hypothetical protein
MEKKIGSKQTFPLKKQQAKSSYSFGLPQSKLKKGRNNSKLNTSTLCDKLKTNKLQNSVVSFSLKNINNQSVDDIDLKKIHAAGQ